jgi:hypothetical protein
MDSDPYDNMPSLEDLKTSGATDWFSDSLAQQKKRNAALKAALGGETETIRAERESLKNFIENPPEEAPEDVPPDLFAAERAQTAKQNEALSGMMGDLNKAQAAEKEMLKNLFGDK